VVTELVLRTVIQATAEECFRLSLSVDAHTASMGRSKERAVAGVTEGEMTLGDSVTWQAKHFGVPFRMTSAITAYDRPHRFVDQQARGPFREWWHEHTFIEQGGSTVMTDVVRYSAPAGPLGRLMDGLVIRSYMQRLLEARNAWLKSELERG
jgi:ligand-binding SRPBCC domain-containing protein